MTFAYFFSDRNRELCQRDDELDMFCERFGSDYSRRIVSYISVEEFLD